MSIVAVFSGSFCDSEEVVQHILWNSGNKLVTDKQVIASAAMDCDMSEQKIRRAFTAKTSVFNKFTREKEFSIACLKRALAHLLHERPLVVQGFSSCLIPNAVSHVLRVCLIAETSYRIEKAREQADLTKKEAFQHIRRHDEDCSAWTEALFSVSDPWDPSLYDMVIPVSQMGTAEAASLIRENLWKEAVRRNPLSEAAEKDFLLAASVDLELSRAGHDVSVKAEDGVVTLTISKHVLMLSRLKEDLATIVEKVPGVKSVETHVGGNQNNSQIYRRHNFGVPSKVLLVDDEREFVQTLSERLELREMGAAVAYDGESALNIVHEDDPEVMIIDLKMPGIDGIEVLRQVKLSRPEIEVIILTGHGSEKDRKLCAELGAFAYLQKPTDIDKIGETLKKAYDKIQNRRLRKS